MSERRARVRAAGPEQGALGAAACALAAERGLTRSAITAQMASVVDRAEAYRIVAGFVHAPQLPALVALCRALGCSPDVLLRRAGWWPAAARGTDPLDVQLRVCFARVARWPARDRRWMVALCRALLADARAGTPEQEKERRTGHGCA